MSQKRALLLDIARIIITALTVAASGVLLVMHRADAKVFDDNPFDQMLPDQTVTVTTSPIKPPKIPTSTSVTRIVPKVDDSSSDDIFDLFSTDTPAFGDDRAARLDAYFTKYNMPLAGHGAKFVEVADNCDIDWQLLPAIAVKESSGGKHMRLNNPFGWASAKIGFDSLDDAIETVGEHICGLNPATAKYYKNKTTMQKLYAYNGTVVPSYPSEVAWIMTLFK